MSKPVTISLPFTNSDEVLSPKWYHGSRLRNRTLTIAASFVGCIILLLFIRRIVFSGASVQPLDYKSRPASVGIYDGAPVTQQGLSHMIVVAGHAIWRGGDSYDKDTDWILTDLQENQSAVFVQHIQKAAALASEDVNSLIIYSGGESRPKASGRTESQSYARLTELLIERGEIQLKDMSRITTEQFARDSYENLLFSIARFFEVTDRYPTHISVVGYSFKRDRYVKLHRKALGFPLNRFDYHGIDPPNLDLAAAVDGEAANARLLFENDMYGCHDKTLVDKKKMRNPARRRHGYELSNPLLAPLLDFCPLTQELFAGRLPWS